jgi:phytoene/squalene synthetase
MNPDPAAAITKAASQQTYYTIRFLVDRDRIPDAYRAYGYFRWVDDTLDSELGSESGAAERRTFLERQIALLEDCYRGVPQPDANIQERMLVELIRRDQEKDSGLQSYLRNMMRVMEFDARRRGRLISQSELDAYTRWLAVAVTDNIGYFIGHDDDSPRDETRYLAVSAAHIVHMLRDTGDDIRAGYFNIPREVLEANRIGPQDVESAAYRAWVKGRVQLARDYFEAGKVYLKKVRNLRYRLAGCAYMARFEWLLETMERENFVLRPCYAERKSPGTGFKMIRQALTSLSWMPGEEIMARPVVRHGQGKA